MESKVKVEYEIGIGDLVSAYDLYYHMRNCLGFVIKDCNEERWEMYNTNNPSIFGEDLDYLSGGSVEDIIYVNDEDYVIVIENGYDYKTSEIDNEYVFGSIDDAIKEILKCWKMSAD